MVEDFTHWRPAEMTVGLIRRGWHWISVESVLGSAERVRAEEEQSTEVKALTN
jgi:hypothetical protein